MPPVPDQLRRHHAVDVARAAQDAHQPERDHREHEHRRREQERSHRGDPGRHSCARPPAPATSACCPLRAARRSAATRRGSGMIAIALPIRRPAPARHQAGDRGEPVARRPPAAGPPDRRRIPACSGTRGSSARRAPRRGRRPPTATGSAARAARSDQERRRRAAAGARLSTPRARRSASRPRDRGASIPIRTTHIRR